MNGGIRTFHAGLRLQTGRKEKCVCIYVFDMQRVYNEATKDKTASLGGRGGVKIGDFGVGGRTYSKTYTRGHGSSQCPVSGKTCGGILSVVAVLLLFFSERFLYLTIGALDEAGEQAVTVNTPTVDSANQGKVVFAQSVNPIVDGAPPRDDFFNIHGDSTDGAMKRVTEYCQWAEMRHSRHVKVGKHPDRCVSTGQSSHERCARVTCSLVQCSSPCCRIERGADIMKEEVWYTYHKSWRHHRIHSLTFDNPAAYHNPQRDPAPTKMAYSGDVDLTGGTSPLNGLRMKSHDFEPVMRPFRTMYLEKNHVSNISPQALDAGFGEADHQYIYSRVKKDGLEYPVIRAAASYLVDGVIDVNEISRGLGVESLLSKAGLDWITKGTCNAGDVRVHFESRALPTAASIVGKQANNYLIPNYYSNGQTFLFMKPTIMDLNTLLEATLADSKWWSILYRVCITALFLGGGYLLTEGPFYGALFASLSFLGVFLWYYGLNDVLIPCVASLLSIASIVAFSPPRAKAKFD